MEINTDLQWEVGSEPQIRTPPLGRCIYCGSGSYEPIGDARLADEHIVPYALNGRYVLAEASCHRCEGITNKFENAILRGGFHGMRVFLNLKSRKKSHPSELPLFDVNGVKGNKVMVNIQDYPCTVLFPGLRTPAILELPEETSPNSSGVFLPLNYNSERLHSLGIYKFGTNAFDLYSFARMLAKIGFCLAVDRYGLNSFHPWILPFIMNDKGAGIYQLVGAAPYSEDKSGETHDLMLKLIQLNGKQLIAAQIRLFSDLDTPWYYVIIGEPLVYR